MNHLVNPWQPQEFMQFQSGSSCHMTHHWSKECSWL